VFGEPRRHRLDQPPRDADRRRQLRQLVVTELPRFFDLHAVRPHFAAGMLTRERNHQRMGKGEGWLPK
jgi:hypothetical protein